MFTRLFCNHVWEIKKDIVLPSAVEQMIKNIDQETIHIDKSYFEKKHICIMVCSLCGKIYKSVETN